MLHIGNLNIRSDSEGNATMTNDKHLTAVSQLLRVEPPGIIKVIKFSLYCCIAFS